MTLSVSINDCGCWFFLRHYNPDQHGFERRWVGFRRDGWSVRFRLGTVFGSFGRF